MDTKKFELELKDYDSAVLIAEESFQIHDYSKSLSEYQVALEKAKALFRPTSEQVISCTRGLADSYFANDQLNDAKQLYEDLLVAYSQSSEVSSVDVVTVLFKLAKIADKKLDVSNADLAYNRVLRQSETSLNASHPLCGAIIEAYINFLQRTRTKPELQQELLSKASMASALRAGNDKAKLALSLNSASRRAETPDSRVIETADERLKEVHERVSKSENAPGRKFSFGKVSAIVAAVGVCAYFVYSKLNSDPVGTNHSASIGFLIVGLIFLGAGLLVGPPKQSCIK